MEHLLGIGISHGQIHRLAQQEGRLIEAAHEPLRTQVFGKGSGTVVTGTLAEGTLRRGEVLELEGRPVVVRGVHCLGQPVDQVSGTARVALNLRGVGQDDVRRGNPLLAPGRWRQTDVVDVRIGRAELPAQAVLHFGSAAVGITLRRLPAGGGDGDIFRLRLTTPLPLQVGDRILLRDPGRRLLLDGATVLDPAPPALGRRGAARARAAALAHDIGTPDLGRELARRGASRVAFLRAIGVPPPDPLPRGVVTAGGWLVEQRTWDRWLDMLDALVKARSTSILLDAGVSRIEMARALELPDAQLLARLLSMRPELEEIRGHIRRRGAAAGLRPDIAAAVDRLAGVLRENPFGAPERPELATLGFGYRELGAAAAAGAILRLPGEVVLLPDAPRRAADRLRSVSQPFTLASARQALGTTRRVAVPLLEHMDAIGVTERLDRVLRRLRPRALS
jgi:selenocysteine-specific elongation factor